MAYPLDSTDMVVLIVLGSLSLLCIIGAMVADIVENHSPREWLAHRRVMRAHRQRRRDGSVLDFTSREGRALAEAHLPRLEREVARRGCKRCGWPPALDGKCVCAWRSS